MKRWMWLGLALTQVGVGQGPVVSPRGVVNAFTRQPAPSLVAPGGLLLIEGLNLGPAEEQRAEGAPWPTELGGVEVAINNRRAGIGWVSPAQVLVQVPGDVAAQLAQVVVRRGGQQSRPAFVRVAPRAPSVATVNGEGWGEAGKREGSEWKGRVSGVSPDAPLTVWVGGLIAEGRVEATEGKPGEYTVTVALPERAREGDVVTLDNGGAIGNRVMLGQGRAQMLAVGLPAEARQQARTLRDADLRGEYVVLSGTPGDGGCYPSWLADVSRGSVRRLEECLIAAQPNAPSPVVGIPESGVVAAMVGPASGNPQAGLSNRVLLFQPWKESPRMVELPAAISGLTGTGQGELAGLAPGTPPRAMLVNGVTGEVREAPAAPVAAGGGGTQPVGGLPVVDLGDGFNQPLSTAVGVGAGQVAVIVGDHAEQPTKARLGLLNNRGEVTGWQDFPTGWIPLLGPLPATRLPGAPAPLRAALYWDAPSRTLYVLGRRGEGGAHGVLRFVGPEFTDPRASALPEGWFAATCISQVRVFTLELARRIAFFGAGRSEDQLQQPCLAQGFLTVELDSGQVRAVAFPGQGQANVQAAADVNDYLYAANVDAVNRQLSDTLYVLDGATGSTFRMDLPAGMTSFAGPQPVGQLSGVVATAMAGRTVGDGGLVFFDLSSEQTRTFPVPEGFESTTLVGVFANTRKLVARGLRTGAVGSQYLIYDMVTGDVETVANPEGVAFVGQLPAAGGGTTPPGAPGGGPGGTPGGGTPGGGAPGGGAPGGGIPAPAPQAAAVMQIVNVKANTVTAVGFGENRQPAALVVLRVP